MEPLLSNVVESCKNKLRELHRTGVITFKQLRDGIDRVADAAFESASIGDDSFQINIEGPCTVRFRNGEEIPDAYLSVIFVFTVDGLYALPMWGGWVQQATTTPSPIAPPSVSFFADDAEHTNAVAQQGVVIPRGPIFYTSTHWDVLNDWIPDVRFADARKNVCDDCGRRTRTRLHHPFDWDRWGMERIGELAELCDPCHARRHGAGVWKRAA